MLGTVAASRRLMDNLAFARLLGFGVLAGLFSPVGCAENEQMMAASLETPAAQGMVSTSPGENDNLVVRVTVKHLAPPYRLVSGATTYVVWVDAPGLDPQNVGALKVDDDLEGRLEFVTPHRVFRVIVTPEAQATTGTPSQRAVFTADVNER